MEDQLLDQEEKGDENDSTTEFEYEIDDQIEDNDSTDGEDNA